MDARRNLTPALCGALALIGSACADPSLAKCSALIRQYVVKDGRVVLQETASKLDSLDRELQFDIYHCAARRMMPPLTDLLSPIASQGGATGDFLVQTVRDAPDDATILSALELLAEMKRQNTYNVAHNQETMTMLNARIQGMRDAHERASAQSRLHFLADDP